MINTVWFCQFKDAFSNIWRGESFSYKGLKALFEYLTHLEDDCGITIELDPIAFDCEYTEYSDSDEIAKNYFNMPNMEFDEDGEETMTVDELEEARRNWLNDRCQVIEFDGGIIISNF